MKNNYRKIIKLFIFNFIVIITIIILLFLLLQKKVNITFLLVCVKILELLLWFIFSLKNIKLVLQSFLVSIWSQFFKKMM